MRLHFNHQKEKKKNGNSEVERHLCMAYSAFSQDIIVQIPELQVDSRSLHRSNINQRHFHNARPPLINTSEHNSLNLYSPTCRAITRKSPPQSTSPTSTANNLSQRSRHVPQDRRRLHRSTLRQM